MSTLKVNSIQNATGTTAITLDASGNATFAGTVVSNSAMGMRNRIINGDMRIDQRNAGASITANAEAFPVDRFKISTGYSSKATVQQSTTAPTGFNNSILLTSSAGTSTASGDYMTLLQIIEGLNTADLGWGTASAKTVTLSFWVRSSLTGTFGGAITNSGNSRSYVFSYTISAANTWEQKTITIAGDTSGTWLTTNGIGLIVRFSIAMGSTYTNTAGSWYAGDYEGATGQTQILNTNGATWYITGVQLEVGTTATPFERRMYGQELALCQRYFETNFSGVSIPTPYYTFYASLPVGSNTYAGGVNANQQILGMYDFKVFKRAAPTVTIYSWIGNTTTAVSNGWTGSDFGSNSGKIATTTYEGFTFYNGTGSNITTGGYSVLFNYTASAEL